jgi:hypothetical protein
MSTSKTAGLAADPADIRGTIPDSEVPERAVRRRYTARYKARMVAEYERLDATGRRISVRLQKHYLRTALRVPDYRPLTAH